jgi:hypothetical protein
MNMPRMGRKTLYLDLDQLDRIQKTLDGMPGKPSLSAFLSDNLHLIAERAEQLAQLLQPDAKKED